MERESFSEWCILEVFGKTRLAGRVSEQVIGGQGFVRIDVPATQAQPAFTKFYGPSSIFCMSPVTEEVARAAAERMTAPPLDRWDMQEALARLPKPAPAAGAAQPWDEEGREF